VLSAPEGCDHDFLQVKTLQQLAFTEPVIGRPEGTHRFRPGHCRWSSAC
jgi:hypothetical protein